MNIAATERLRLRTIDVSDAAFYLELLNSAEFIANIGDRKIRNLEAARKAIREGPLAMQAARGHSIYLVELKASGTPIGMSGLIKRDSLDEVDLGYAFLPDYFGNGNACEAALAVLEHARKRVGLARVVAITSPGNTASNRVLGKVGMRFDKIVHRTTGDTGTRLYVIDLVFA